MGMGSCLDIYYAINIVAKFASCPYKNHYVTVERIFKYLARTFDLAFYYDGNTNSNLIEAYIDANYARDITNFKLRTRFFLLFEPWSCDLV
jgi:hypothetical protein